MNAKHAPPAIETKALSKRFGAIEANKNVSLSIPKGTIHGIIGENGAGKSTLMNMLFGLYQPDKGRIGLNGKVVNFSSPADAMIKGVGMVHQHFMLVENFTVLENIILGDEPSFFLDHGQRQARKKLEALEKEFKLEVPLNALISTLSVGQQQRVEILKTLYRGAEIIILDEPTGVLTPQETNKLLTIMRRLKSQGKTILFISHKLAEIKAVTDNITVMRQGEVVANAKTSKMNIADMAVEMVGKIITRAVERNVKPVGEAILSLDQITSAASSGHTHALKDISFDVNEGEVVGIAGVSGNGQTQLMEIITGMASPTTGRVTLNGTITNSHEGTISPLALRKRGLAHVADDRLKTGVAGTLSAEENGILGYHDNPAFLSRGLLKRTAIKETVQGYFERYDVRPRDTSLPLNSFSGGNQQKQVIAREIEQNPNLLVIGQPTRGVDIGAVTNIHDQIIALRNDRKGVLVISADLDELLALSDRIIVMCEGRITGEVAIENADEETLGLMMADSVKAKKDVA